MIITVSPGIPRIIIEECEDQEQCPQQIVTTESVLCTISGFRPAMYLSIETNNAEAKLYKVDETVTEDELTGTSTTSVIYAYEVPKCSENLVLTCGSVPDKYNRPSLHANLSLNSVFIGSLKKKARTRDPEKGHSELADDESATKEETEILLPKESSSVETKDATKPDDPHQKYFYERFHPFLKEICNGKANDSGFERILILFKSKYQEADVKLTHGQSIENDNPSKEDLLAVIKFFANSSYVSGEGFHVLLLAAVKTTKLLPQDGLAIVGEYFKTEKIDSKSFATITTSLINEKDVGSSKVLKLLKKVSRERKHPEADVAEVLTHLFVLDVITSEMVTRQMQTDFSKSGHNIPFLFFMLVVEGEYSKTEDKGKLLELLTTVTTTMKSQLDFGVNISSLDKEEINVTSIISKIIGSIVKEHMLKVDDLMYILQSRCQANKITVTLLTTVLEDLLANEQMTLQQYVGHLKTGFVGHSIDGQELLFELQQCKKENLINGEKFVDYLLKLLSTKKLDFEKSILAFQDCKYQKLITEDSYITLMSTTLESEKMHTKLFIDGVKCCREENLITLDTFVKLLENALNYQEVTEETIIGLLLDALNGQEITQTSFFSLLTKALEHGKVSEERTQKLVLDNLKNDKLEKEALVKFTITLVNVQSYYVTDPRNNALGHPSSYCQRIWDSKG